MNEFFAADPESCENSGELRFLLGLFGPRTGRYLAEYPCSWAKDIAKHCERLGALEAERQKVILRRARENAVLLRKSTLPWNERANWIENYCELTKLKPNEFAGAVVSRTTSTAGFATIDDLDLSPTADESIEAIASEYVRVSKTLLLISPELIFVDPFLNPCKNDRRDVLVELFRVAAKGKCRKITCWANASKIIGDKLSSKSEIDTALTRILEFAEWPLDRTFRYILVDDSRGSSKMHARHLLSIKGGIRYDQGFQRLSKGRRNEVSPLGVGLHDELLKMYHEESHDMSVEYSFERGTS